MKLFLSFLLFILVSCNKPKHDINEFYDVLNQIYPLLSAEIAPPDSLNIPPPLIDSLNLNYNYNTQMNGEKKLLVTGQIIAIDPDLMDLGKSPIINSGSPFGNINYERVISNIDSINIDLIISGKDSIVYFSKELLEPQMKDYLKFDKLISFSKIFFDKNFNHAVIIGTVGTSSLAASSHIFFLRKVEGKWIVVDNKLLEIS